MERRLIGLALIVATAFLTGCQTSVLKPESGNLATATVEHPIFLGATHISVVLAGKTYAGVAGELHEDVTGEQALRFGWSPGQHHSVRHKLRYFFGSTILTNDDGGKLACDHLKYVEEWRLRCKIGEGKEIALYRVEL